MYAECMRTVFATRLMKARMPAQPEAATKVPSGVLPGPSGDRLGCSGGPLWVDRGALGGLRGSNGVLWRPSGGQLGCSGRPMGVNWGALGARWGSTGMPWGPYGGQLGCSGEARCMRNVCGMYAECMRDLAVDSRGAESALKQQRHETQMQGIYIYIYIYL